MTTLDVLVGARDLIARPECWTKKALARSVTGSVALAGLGDKGVCWCLDGALMEASGEAMPSEAYGALGFSTDDETWMWNDAPERTHAEVLARLDAGIAKLRAEVQ